MNDFASDPRFAGIEPFPAKLWLSSPTMHGEEQHWVDEAIRTNWVSTVGENINEVEKQIAAYVGVKHAVALSAGTAALHLATKLAGEKLYGQARPDAGTLAGKKVFCSDMTFDASINPVAYEDGEAVFIDTERGTWNMDPEALEKAFEIYPEVRLVVIAHLYGTPGRMEELLFRFGKIFRFLLCRVDLKVFQFFFCFFIKERVIRLRTCTDEIFLTY